MPTKYEVRETKPEGDAIIEKSNFEGHSEFYPERKVSSSLCARLVVF